MNTLTSTETLMGGRKYSSLKRDNTTEEIFIRQIVVEFNCSLNLVRLKAGDAPRGQLE